MLVSAFDFHLPPELIAQEPHPRGTSRLLVVRRDTGDWHEATIADLSYPGARKLYIYLKGEHLAAKPALKDFVAAFAKQWGARGPLEKRGLVPFAGADADAATKQASELKPLDPSTLK